MSKVSICITTYNRGNSLAKTLESILNQTFTDFELIISDDNSTDDTRNICEKYEKNDSRVKYFRNEINLKMPGNLNNAISKASCEFVANLHDGDIYRTDLIEKWYNTLSKYPEALFVFNEYLFIDENGKTKNIIRHEFKEINDGIKLAEYFFSNLSSGPWGTVMARKSAYDTYGMFNPEFGFISDVEMWLRFAYYGKFCYITEPLISLTSREINHPYYLPHTLVTLNNFKILSIYFNKFLLVYPVIKSRKKSLQLKIKKYIFWECLILLKYLKLKKCLEHIILIIPFFNKRLFLFFNKINNNRYQLSTINNWMDIIKLNYK